MQSVSSFFWGMALSENTPTLSSARLAIFCWLVVSTPLKILVSWVYYSQHMEKQKMFETTNQSGSTIFGHITSTPISVEVPSVFSVLIRHQGRTALSVKPGPRGAV